MGNLHLYVHLYIPLQVLSLKLLINFDQICLRNDFSHEICATFI